VSKLQKTILKQILFLLVFVSACIVCYGAGYHNAAEDVFLFEKVGNAGRDLHTICLLKKNRFEDAESILLTDLSANVAGIKDIAFTERSITSLPQRFFFYWNAVSQDREAIINSAKIILDDVEEHNDEIMPKAEFCNDVQ